LRLFVRSGRSATAFDNEQEEIIFGYGVAVVELLLLAERLELLLLRRSLCAVDSSPAATAGGAMATVAVRRGEMTVESVRVIATAAQRV
jgi:hypothetical protein